MKPDLDKFIVNNAMFRTQLRHSAKYYSIRFIITLRLYIIILKLLKYTENKNPLLKVCNFCMVI